MKVFLFLLPLVGGVLIVPYIRQAPFQGYSVTRTRKTTIFASSSMVGQGCSTTTSPPTPTPPPPPTTTTTTVGAAY